MPVHAMPFLMCTHCSHSDSASSDTTSSKNVIAFRAVATASTPLVVISFGSDSIIFFVAFDVVVLQSKHTSHLYFGFGTNEPTEGSNLVYCGGVESGATPFGVYITANLRLLCAPRTLLATLTIMSRVTCVSRTFIFFMLS